MQQIKNSICFFVLISGLFLIGCNESATTSEKNDTDTTSFVTNSDTSSMPAYDPAMDPLTVGAAFSKKLGDTLNTKMYVATLKPGDSVALHTHPDHTFYVLQGGKIEATIQGKGRQVFDLKKGMGWIGGPATDFGKNIGNTTVKWLEVDIYRPRGGSTSSMPGYDPTLDPLTVGAAFSKKLGDTLNIKMFEVTLKPGDSMALHTHPDHAIYVLQGDGGKMAITIQGASREEVDGKTGAGWITGPITDFGKNIGNTIIKFLEVDIYRPRGK
jgi:quercetin dioxygenase-like cupin family protein